MKRFSFVMVVVLFVAVMIITAGCGMIFDRAQQEVEERIDEIINLSEEEAAIPGEEEADIGETETVGEEEFHTFTSILDVAERFEEFVGLFVDTEIGYRFLGRETVDGIETERMIINYAGAEFECWVSDDLEIVKGRVAGEEVPEGDIGQFEFFIWALEPFFAEQNWDENWRDAEVTSLTKDLGGGPLDITHLSFELPGMPDHELEAEYTEVDGLNLMVRYWQNFPDGNDGGWEIIRLIPR